MNKPDYPVGKNPLLLISQIFYLQQLAFREFVCFLHQTHKIKYLSSAYGMIHRTEICLAPSINVVTWLEVGVKFDIMLH